MAQLIFKLIKSHGILFSLGLSFSLKSFLDSILLEFLFELLPFSHDMILQSRLHGRIQVARRSYSNHFVNYNHKLIYLWVKIYGMVQLKFLLTGAVLLLYNRILPIIEEHIKQLFGTIIYECKGSYYCFNR